MVAITIQDFGGRIPRRAARLLPDNYSQVAENVKLIYGDLRGYNDFKIVHEFPTGSLPRRVFHIKNTAQTADAWYGSTDPDVSLIKSPIVNDAFDRYYIFQKGLPPQVATFTDIVDGDPTSDLAFSQPTNAPTLSQTGGSSTNVFTRVYTYTFVTTWGEESTISPTTAIDVREDATSVTVNINTGSPTIEGRSFQYVRIYRTVTSDTGGQFYFVADVPFVVGAITPYVDTNSDVAIASGSALTSSQNDPPPDGIWGARLMGNGSIVAFKDRDIYFSIPYMPSAWPQDWRLTVPDVIVGIEVMADNVMVLTKGFPVLLYGSYPDAMGVQKFSFSEPCISYGSIVAAPEGVYFGSYNGLCLFTPTGVELLTREMIGRNDWQEFYLDSETRAERLTTRYIASKTDTNGYIIDGLETRIALTDLVGWLTVGDICPDHYTSDVLAISFDAVYAWDDWHQLEVDYRWKSKKFVLSKPTSFGAMMLHIETRTTEWTPTSIFNAGYSFPEGMDKKTQMLVKVWGDGVLLFDRPVKDKEQCRLPSQQKYTVWEVEVQGQCRTQRIALAEVGSELSAV